MYFSIGIFITWILGHVRLGSIRNKNNWNNVSKRLFGSYYSGIPEFPFWLFCFWNSQNIFWDTCIFLFQNIRNERTLHCQGGNIHFKLVASSKILVAMATKMVSTWRVVRMKCSIISRLGKFFFHSFVA